MRKILQKKIILFFIQLIALSIIIFGFGYNFMISFDPDISMERKIIIQLLANYILFGGVDQFLFLSCSWFFVILVPIFALNNYKKTVTMNLSTFFFPNFFFYVFLARYSTNYYNSNIQFLMIKTIMLGVIILLSSLTLTFIVRKVRKTNKRIINGDLEQSEQNPEFKCMNCGAEFGSQPKYCYNCLTKLIEEDKINE